MALFSCEKEMTHMVYCPYTVNRHLVQQTTQEYDESGNQTLQQVIEHNTAEFIECKKGIMRRMARWEVPL